MAESAGHPAVATDDDRLPSSSAFIVHERRVTDKAVFVYTSFLGDEGPPAPPPLPVVSRSDGVIEAPVQSGASALSSVFVMANSTVGAGVLSLPFAFQETGLVGGLLLCVAVGTVEALTLYVLSKFAERYSAVTYVELVRRALGRKLAALLSAVLVVAMFGACVAYLIILADNLTSLAAAAGLPLWLSNRHNVVAVLGVGVLLPMCIPRYVPMHSWVTPKSGLYAILRTLSVLPWCGIGEVAIERTKLAIRRCNREILAAAAAFLPEPVGSTEEGQRSSGTGARGEVTGK
ncbi:hypothetical protein Vretimale_6647 [Volvox reticuliferus]|uniref:Amino acid transporter transmembrane domain-containing protein n=1 Tax=Volvox reticuliferus TaxID=1737510 RepID=A0A8J4G8D6_9CHLO|nr:hypothetical protein Vretimale_6647 [Volvox reticuliferus]